MPRQLTYPHQVQLRLGDAAYDLLRRAGLPPAVQARLDLERLADLHRLALAGSLAPEVAAAVLGPTAPTPAPQSEPPR